MSIATMIMTVKRAWLSGSVLIFFLYLTQLVVPVIK